MTIPDWIDERTEWIVFQTMTSLLSGVFLYIVTLDIIREQLMVLAGESDRRLLRIAPGGPLAAKGACHLLPEIRETQEE